MKLFNTLARKKEEIEPIKDNEIGMYTCGPTVYYYPHIGNMATYIREDLLKRVLEHDGLKVKHVMNFTDVGHLVSDEDVGEDKLRKEAEKEKKTMKEIAEFYGGEFLKYMSLLNNIKPNVTCKASDHIEEIIELTKKLEGNGFLYVIPDGVYFNTSKFKNYGELIPSTFEKLNANLKAGARVERPEGLKNITDFAVWRFARKGEKEMVWDSPWGRGFPGWHIECSAMSMKYLGETFDIHCGGIDHIPIHHTNEIAQSEAATGKKFVNTWVHFSFININGGKMAKSLRNIYTVQDLIDKGFDPLDFRFFVLTGHYRQGLNFTFEALENAKTTLNKIYGFIENLKNFKEEGFDKNFAEKISELKNEFFEAVNDDLNTPTAIAKMHEIIKEANKKHLSKKDAEFILNTLLDFDSVLGLNFSTHSEKKELSKEVEKLVDEREKFRKSKNFKEADRIRNTLKNEYHVIIEDSSTGLKWRFEK
ncbi:MAG: cysteine--tRNA ligase [Candidatus Marsarchaeota archaeon]|nr:cysteine--tRNA ligase [Candidatus Marsarchaeota archaeon]